MPAFMEALAARLATFTREEAAVARHAFRALLAGTPAGVAEMPAALGLTADAAASALSRLTERGTLAVSDGRIVVARGLSAAPTPHAVRVADDATVYACCAVDAVGIPAALGLVARVEARCEECAAPVRVAIRDGAASGEPTTTVVWAVDVQDDRPLRQHT